MHTCLVVSIFNHPNIIRYRGVGCDEDFLFFIFYFFIFFPSYYVVLGTLDDLVKMPKGMLCVPVNDPRYPLKEIVEKVPQFIEPNGRPSPLLVKLMWLVECYFIE